ncbi:MAG: lipopolysaccharide biosynthesis protein [Myxococcota bacterium]
MSEVRSSVARGAAWMVVARLLDRGLGLISTLILARLLTPDDFGLIAMAMSVVALLDLLRAFGFDVVLIQHPDPTREHYDTAWTFNIGVCAAVAAVLAALAYPASIFFDEADLTAVMLLLALSPLISSLRNIGIVDFRKKLEFDREFRFMFFARLSRFVVTIPLAFWLRNHWALVAGMLSGRAFEVVLSYVMHPYRPRPSLAVWRELYHFSKWLVIKNMVQLLTQRSADFVIGRIAGIRALGLFNVSYEIAYLPSSELAAPLNRAIFPGYAKHAEDRQALGRGMLEVVGMVALVILPAGAGLMATADYVVPVLLGDAWLEAIPIVPVLALHGLLTALGSNAGYLFFTLGKPRIVSNVAMLQLVVLLPGLIIGVSRFGVIGAAWAYAVATSIILPTSYGILLRELSLPVSALFARIWRPLVAMSAMVVLVREMSAWMPEADGTFELMLQLGVLVGVGNLSYIAAVTALWWASRRPDGAERYVLDRVLHRVPGLAGRAGR